MKQFRSLPPPPAWASAGFPWGSTGHAHGGLGFPPVQSPHPPIEMAAQSRGATERAARLSDAVFFGPQVAWRDIASLAQVYQRARPADGHLYASRCLMVGSSKE